MLIPSILISMVLFNFRPTPFTVRTPKPCARWADLLLTNHREVHLWHHNWRFTPALHSLPSGPTEATRRVSANPVTSDFAMHTFSITKSVLSPRANFLKPNIPRLSLRKPAARHREEQPLRARDPAIRPSKSRKYATTETQNFVGSHGTSTTNTPAAPVLSRRAEPQKQRAA